MIKVTAFVKVKRIVHTKVGRHNYVFIHSLNCRLSDTSPERDNKILDNIPKNRLRGKEESIGNNFCTVKVMYDGELNKREILVTLIKA